MIRSFLESSRRFIPPPSRTVSTKAIDGQRIHILGLGNLGKFVARGLRRACPELPITLLFHRPDLLSQWEASGKAIRYTKAAHTDETAGFDVDFSSGDGSTCSPVHNLILLTKTYNTTAALAPIKVRLSKDSTILVVQNGIGTVDEICSTLFESEQSRPQLWTGICSAGVFSTAPFAITHAGIGPFLLGPTLQSGPTTTAVATRLFQARDHLSTSLVSASEIKVAQLLKLVVNAIINPLTAVFNCKNGDILTGARDELVRELIQEIGPVVRMLAPPDSRTLVDDSTGSGVLMFSDEHLLARARLTADRTGANTSSMLQDVINRRRTEIDYINGYIVAHGEKLGYKCNKNKALVEMVKSRTVIKDDQISAFFPS